MNEGKDGWKGRQCLADLQCMTTLMYSIEMFIRGKEW